MHMRADFLGRGLALVESEATNVEAAVVLRLFGSDVLDQQSAVRGLGLVRDGVVGLDTLHGEGAVLVIGDLQLGIGDPHVAVVDHLVDLDGGDFVHHIAGGGQTVHKVDAGLDGGVEGRHLQRGHCAARHLGHFEGGRRLGVQAIEEDVGLDIGRGSGQFGRGVIGVGASDESEVHAFTRGLDPWWVDGLVAGADGPPVGLAGVDCISAGNVAAVGLVDRMLAGDDDGRLTVANHEEEVLTRWNTLQRESLDLAGGDPEVVGQIDRLIGVAAVRLEKRFVLNGPHLGAVYGCAALLQVTGKDDVTARIGHIVIGRPCALATEHDVVVDAVGPQEDFGAGCGLEVAVVATERMASGIGEGRIDNAGCA